MITEEQRQGQVVFKFQLLGKVQRQKDELTLKILTPFLEFTEAVVQEQRETIFLENGFLPSIGRLYIARRTDRYNVKLCLIRCLREQNRGDITYHLAEGPIFTSIKG